VIDYGADFLLVDDDLVFTSDGDLAAVSGAAAVAQDIAQTLKVTPGALAWDATAGSSLLLMLNDAGASDGAVVAELERVAIDDPRVDPDAVKAEKTDARKYRLSFAVIGAVEPQTLDFDLAQGGGK
jgi:hypothetical protein